MRRRKEENHYEALGISPIAAPAEIRSAYEKLSAVFDPNSLALYSLAAPEEQRQALNRIREAYRVLSEPAERLAYDVALGLRPAPVEVSPAPETDPGQQELFGPRRVDAAPRSRVPVSEPGEDSHSDRAAEPATHVRVEQEGGEADAQVETHVTHSGDRSEHDPEPAELLAPSETATEAADEVIQVGEEDLVEGWEAERDEPPTAYALTPAIDADTEFTGALLRAVRESRGLSLRDVSSRTRIGVNHLENIEQETFTLLPSRVFLRGFLLSYAKELRLDPARVAETYLRRREQGAPLS